MKKHEIITYSFDELSEDAKEKAINHFRNDNFDFDYITDEARNTLDKFCDIFSIEWNQFDYCEMYRSEWRIKLDENILALSGIRLSTYIHNNFYNQITKGKYYGCIENDKKYDHPCIKSKELTNKGRLKNWFNPYYSRITREIDNLPLTGVCYDYSILQPIIDFLKKPNKGTDFETLLNDCLHSLAHDVCSEIEYHQSDKGIQETIEANEYEFTEDGKLF